jgi:hypothetical protein
MALRWRKRKRRVEQSFWRLLVLMIPVFVAGVFMYILAFSSQ